ncbi:T9SS type A sorting domain-containing protein [Chryseobacterium sp. KMC2]|uniref:T9SS type A sorting domain-containing protein n=1 Tax=Chryseobacterium sp. KMC2 TaxID=2800705 RepID=UPI0019243B88|nr:T9SS type A sorting domain-containing protein [Chryseobacterium sp. KMC2]MBL3547727.1 T9SS type A sorting domain-containing protein [Chryseobacterium sp. KMC2]
MKFNYKKTIPVLAGIFFSGSSMAQAPAIEWQKSLGGSGKDYANSIIQTADGGYMMAGNSNSNNGNVTGNHGKQDYWLAKLNSTGNLQWQKSLGGTENDQANSIIQTADGGYVVAGTTNSNNGDVTGNHGLEDGWVLKLNSDAGVIHWKKTFGGSNTDAISKIIPTTDGGYIFTGSSMSNNGDVAGNNGYVDYWIVKINSDGNIQWKKSFGGTGDDQANSIVQMNDGGYVVSGYAEGNTGDITGNHGNTDFWILRLNADGGVVFWKKSFGGLYPDQALSMVKTSDGGFIMAGQSFSTDGDVTGNHGGTDYWIVKIDEAGNLQWQKALGGTKLDRAYSIIQSSDGGYLVVGNTISTDGQVAGYHAPINPGPGELPPSFDYWAVKLSAIGNIQWQKCIGGSESDEASSVIQTADGGYVIAGSSKSNNGDVTGNHGDYDAWVVKLAPEHLATSEIAKEASVTATIFPNPAKDYVTLKLDYFTPSMEATITDMLGKTVHQQKLEGLKTKINTSHLEKGVYFLNVLGGTQKTTKKFIIE